MTEKFNCVCLFIPSFSKETSTSPLKQQFPKVLVCFGLLCTVKYYYLSKLSFFVSQCVNCYCCFPVTQLCSTLSTPWAIDYQNHHLPLSMGFPRQEYWSGLPFPSPENLPDPGIESMSPALQEDSLPLNHQGSPHCKLQLSKLYCQNQDLKV